MNIKYLLQSLEYWLTYDTLMTKADGLIGEFGEIPTVCLKQAINQTMEEFARKETLEEMHLSPCIPPVVRCQIMTTVSELPLYAVRTCNETTGEQDTFFEHRYLPDKVVEILKQNGGSSGKYNLIAKDSLPSLSDVK